MAIAFGCAGASEPPIERPTEPTASVDLTTPPEPTRTADPCAARSLERAIADARAALAEADLESHARLGLALEQALACEVGARRWELELDAVRLLAQIDPLPEPSPQRCRTNSEAACVYGRGEPQPVWELPLFYDELALARLDAYTRYEAEAPPGESLRAIRDRHIRVRLDYRDFEAAVPLLQSYVVDYEHHPSAARAAVLLVDAMFNRWAHLERWTQWRGRVAEPPRYAATSALAWFDRLEGLAFWSDPAAAELRELIAELRPGVMWRAGMEARDEAIDEVIASGAPRRGHRLRITPGVEYDGFRRCGELFLDIYASYPKHDRPATLLWNAADCFDAHFDFDRAYAARETLLARFPDSEHSMDTLHYLAESDHAIGRYDRAADRYLEFALRYPKDGRSLDDLVLAYRFAAALGRDTTDIVEAYMQRQQKRDIQAAGAFLWQTRPDEPERLLAFALAFLKTFGTKAGITSHEVARVVVELSWAHACRARLYDGLCVATEPAEPPSCAIGDRPLPRFVARPNKLADQARAHAKRESKRHARSIKVGWDEVEVYESIRAAAAFNVLEPDLEAFLLAGPDAPDARTQAERLDAAYRDVVALGQVDHAIRAHARRGLIWETLATPGHREHEGACLPATAWAFGDRRRATSAYADCLALAVEHQRLSASARRCEAWMAAVEPEQVPPARELVGSPGLIGSDVSGIGVLGEPGKS